MKPTPLMTITTVVSILAVAAAAALFWLAGNTNAEAYRASIADVRAIQQLAADWSVETARVRSDPLADFDSLAAFIPQMDTLKSSLLDTVRAVPDIPDRLANDVSAYVNAVEAREERIERFKTGYAVIRNSARYLPLAASNVVQVPEVDGELSREVSALANDINTYRAAPTDAAKGRLMVALERLAKDAEGLPPPLPDAIANFEAHAAVLLSRQAPTDELFSQATSAEISGLSDRLVRDLGVELAAEDARATNYRNGVLGAGLLLLALWAATIAVRVRADRRAAPAQAGTSSAEAAQQVPPTRTADPFDSAAAKHLMAHRILCATVASRIAALATEADEDIAAPDAEAPGARQANGAANRDTGDDAGTFAGVREHLASIREMAEHLAAGAEAGNELSYDLLDVNDCIPGVVEDTGARDAAQVTIERGSVPEVFASRPEICLMLEKVVENSVQAVKDAGRDAGEIRIATATDDGTATITIVDNGAGMSPQVRERMFEPFFAADGERAGVGLVSTGHLVRKYAGAISVSSMPGGGTVTQIRLPGLKGH